MKQVVQNLRSGVLELLDVPCPRVRRGHLLIQSSASLISAGTERFIVEFGKASLVAKARQNPERVKQVLNKIKADGLLPTLEAVFNKLDEPLPLGYCNSGTVIEVGEGVSEFSVGDRIASNGHHAEIVCVPKNLCAKIPDNVSDAEASFMVLGSIALQGIRLLEPQLGETIVVFGLGLVGLLSVQMLVASGVRVIGIDLDANRLKLAEQFGATTIDPSRSSDPVAAALALTGGIGVDGVLVTASAKNDTIMSQSAQMTRKRGRLILVGVVNLELDRAEFYEKELTFQVSCSYGPGRYDSSYEVEGVDYPYPFVRWTEQRNFEAVLQLMASNRLDVQSLTTHTIPHSDAVRAYDLLSSGESQLGIVLDYATSQRSRERTLAVHLQDSVEPAGDVVIGMIGAGAFTKGFMLPALVKLPVSLEVIASAGGVSAAHVARKFGFRNCTTDYHSILSDDRVNTVFITTRHNLHASIVVEALEAGKHVFVEKPLAIDADGLRRVKQAYEAHSDQHLLVGFNRRFSPHIQKARELLKGRSGPLCMSMIVNAGALPADHWQHDPEIGGGRIVGEGCHWIDLLSYLADAPVQTAHADNVGESSGAVTRGDHTIISLTFGDGSIATLHYYANGHASFPKERLTVFSDRRVLELDNFRVLRGYGWSGFRRFKTARQDKGHRAEYEQFVQRVARGGEPLISFTQLENVTWTSLQCELRRGTRDGAQEAGVDTVSPCV